MLLSSGGVLKGPELCTIDLIRQALRAHYKMRQAEGGGGSLVDDIAARVGEWNLTPMATVAFLNSVRENQAEYPTLLRRLIALCDTQKTATHALLFIMGTAPSEQAAATEDGLETETEDVGEAASSAKALLQSAAVLKQASEELAARTVNQDSGCGSDGHHAVNEETSFAEARRPGRDSASSSRRGGRAQRPNRTAAGVAAACSAEEMEERRRTAEAAAAALLAEEEAEAAQAAAAAAAAAEKKAAASGRRRSSKRRGGGGVAAAEPLVSASPMMAAAAAGDGSSSNSSSIGGVSSPSTASVAAAALRPSTDLPPVSPPSSPLPSPAPPPSPPLSPPVMQPPPLMAAARGGAVAASLQSTLPDVAAAAPFFSSSSSPAAASSSSPAFPAFLQLPRLQPLQQQPQHFSAAAALGVDFTGGVGPGAPSPPPLPATSPPPHVVEAGLPAYLVPYAPPATGVTAAVAAAAPEPLSSSAADSDSECCMCLDSPRTHALVPCGALLLCIRTSALNLLTVDRWV